jgi:formate C-acetyltransferase
MNKKMNEAIVTDDQVGTRGQRLWERMLEYRQTAKPSLSRAKLLTASYRETEGYPSPIRRAKAFEKIVTEIPIHIEEDDLLLGAFAARPMDFEWYPEYAVDQEMASSQLDGLLAGGDTEQEVREIIDYFKDRCLQGSFLSRIEEEKRRTIAETCEDGAWVYRAKTTLNIDRGYHAIDYKKAIGKGFLGVLAEIEQELWATQIKDEESYQKANFLKGLVIVLKAGIQYANRHALHARELSKRAEGNRKAELERIADICEWIPANPARGFYEAVQTSWFLHVLMHLESRAQESPGRMDQYLYPYYKRDIANGRLTEKEALEIVECLRVKMSTLRLFNGILYNEIISGEAQYHNVTLGGQTPDGKDATNELSYLFLEAALRARTPHPTLSIRYHDSISEDFVLRGLELVKVGLGFPAFFNDNSAIPWLLALGAPLDEARDYCLGGCVNHIIPGKSSPIEALFINMPKCLELALHDGVDPRTEKQLGPKTGEFDDFETIGELGDSFKKQVTYFSEQGGTIINEQRIARADIVPTMLSSAFVDDCIKLGKSCTGNGARYVMFMQVSVGMIDVADSLGAIKKCVFEEGSISKQELLEALAANFQGKEDLLKLLMNAPKYGNDDDYIDTIAAELYGWWRRMVTERDAPYGLKYLPSPYSISAHGPAGKRVGALPSGRLSGMALADGSVSPCPGMDTCGPTAVMNSAGKIDQIPLFGTLFNMKFHPLALKTKDDMKKLHALIKTYFDYGGKHVQFNVIESKTLREAQEQPELYRNLIVRVAGYSALFTELDRSIQDEIIGRTEHGMA